MIQNRPTSGFPAGFPGFPFPGGFDESSSTQQRPSELARLLLVMVFLHKKLIAWIVGVTAALTIVLCFTLPKIYSGSFSIIVKGSELDTSTLVPGSNVQYGSRPVTPQMVANEERILSGSSLADHALRDLRSRHDTLQLSWADEAKPDWLKAASKALGAAPHAIKSWFVKEEEAAPGSELPGDPLIPMLRDIVTVTPGIGNDVIDVRVRHFDKHVTEDILKTLLKVYLDQRGALWTNAQAPQFYRDQAEARANELTKINLEIQQLKADPAFVAPAEEKTRLTKQLGDMVTEINKLTVHEQELSAQSQRVATLSGRGIRAFTLDGGSSDPMLREITGKIGQLEAQRAEMLRNFSPDSTMVQAVQNELGTLTGQYKQIMIESLANDLANTTGRKKQLIEQVELTKQRLPIVEDAEQKLAVLEQRRNIAREQVSLFQRKQGELETANELRTNLLPNVAVMNDPYVSPDVLFPQRGTLIPLSVVVGLFLGIVVAVLLELLDDSFKLPEQITRELGVPVLATFPLEQAA